MTKILVVEDKIDLRESLKDILEFHDFLVDEAPDLKTASEKIACRTYDVVLLDIKLPDGNGIQLFDNFQEKITAKTIVMTAHPSIPGVVDAIKKGAFNYLEKPFDEELLLAQVKKIVEINRLKEENRSLKTEMSSDFTFDKMTYSGGIMETIIAKARVLAKTENTILLQGETGTGKEVVARSLHNESLRGKETFLPINCAAVPPELFESELFGFEKGAFTGAVDSYSGRFVQADKGTLFLDEIGELPPYIQSKLLRVLEERVIYRLKGAKPIPVNVRLLAATNKNLEEQIKLNEFRNDLYYRLMESSIRIPALRERSEDILPLSRHFMDIFSRLYDKEVTHMSGEVEKFFLNYPWPGNIRELKNTIKSIIPFKRNDTIEIDDLSHSIIGGKKITQKKFLPLEEFENKYIQQVLKVTEFNISRTCDILEISRPRLYRKMKHLDLENRER